MSITLDILTAIGGVFIVLWAFLWTYIRWQRVVHNKEANRQIKNLWWALLGIGVIMLLVALIIFVKK